MKLVQVETFVTVRWEVKHGEEGEAGTFEATLCLRHRKELADQLSRRLVLGGRRESLQLPERLRQGGRSLVEDLQLLVLVVTGLGQVVDLAGHGVADGLGPGQVVGLGARGTCRRGWGARRGRWGPRFRGRGRRRGARGGRRGSGRRVPGAAGRRGASARTIREAQSGHDRPHRFSHTSSPIGTPTVGPAWAGWTL